MAGLDPTLGSVARPGAAPWPALASSRLSSPQSVTQGCPGGCPRAAGTPGELTPPLSAGCTICLGQATFLRFNHPAEAKWMKSMIPAGGRSPAAVYGLPASR